MKLNKIFDNVWTIPNILSIIRMILAPLVGYLLYKDHITAGLITAFIAGMLDIIDGIIARKFNQTSEFGKIIDPLADKILYASAVIAMVLRDWLPLWYVLLFLLRDIIILLGGAVFSKKLEEVPAADKLGKYSVFLNSLFLFIVAAGWHTAPHEIHGLLLLLIYSASVNYFLKAIKSKRNSEIEKKS